MSASLFKPLEPEFSVAAQISAGDLAAAKAQGFAHVVNNRPDGEQPGQPTGAEIAAAAESFGLGYTAIPIDHHGFHPDQVEALRALLDASPGPVLAFCRSGTRSTMLWALTQALRGVDPEILVKQAAGQGYDLSPLKPQLLALSRHGQA